MEVGVTPAFLFIQSITGQLADVIYIILTIQLKVLETIPTQDYLIMREFVKKLVKR